MQTETKTHGAVIVRVERETNSLIRRRWPGSVSSESKKEKNQKLINRAQREKIEGTSKANHQMQERALQTSKSVFKVTTTPDEATIPFCIL